MPRCRNTKSTFTLVALLLGLALLPAVPALAVDSSWNVDAAGNWSTASNWTAGVPNAIDDIARLTYNITGPRTVTIDGSIRTVGSLYLNDDDFGYTLAGVGLKLDVSSGSALIQSDGGTGVTHTISAPVTLNDSTTVAVNSATLQVSGVISSGVAGTGITKTGAGTLTLTAANSFSGPTTVSGGILRLSGASGAITSAAGGIVVNAGGIFKVENTSAANNSNRLADTVVLTMNGGTLNFSNDAGNVNFIETLGKLSLVSGVSTVTTSQAASGKTSTLTFGTNPGIVRAAGATVNFTGMGLGTDTRNRIVFTTAPTLDDGIIGGWAVSGNDFVKYITSPVTSVAPLASGNYYTGASSSWASAHNVKLTGGATSTSGTKVINSLNIAQTSAATLSLGGGTLRVESGGILISGAYGASIQSGTLTAGTGTAAGELIIHQNSANDATISASIGNNGSSAVSLTKAGTGAGSLILSGANTYTGATQVSQGILSVTHASGLGSTGAGDVTVLSGATLDLGVSCNSTGTLTLNGSGVGGQGALRSSGPSAGWSGGIALNGDTVVGVPSSCKLTQWGYVTGTGSLTKVGAGTIVLTNGVGGSNFKGTTIVDGALAVHDGEDTPYLVLAGGVFEGYNSMYFWRGLGTGSYQVCWTGSGGFSANGAILSVTLGGTSTPIALTWGSGGFVPIGSALLFGSETADNGISFKNAIDLAGDVRTITVKDNPNSGGDYAGLSGVLSNGGVFKDGEGTLFLGSSNSYAGTTTVAAGALGGGSSASNLVLAGGVYESSGTFSRAAGTGANQVRWTAGGGFAANTGKLTVAIGGTASPTSLTWGTGGFVPNGSALLFGSATANKEADLTNNINLGGGTRTVTVKDNAFSGADFATLSGVLANGGLIKDGDGTLALKGSNSYSDATTIMTGSLRAVDGVGLPSASNLTLAGGVFEGSTTTTFTRSLGSTGASTVQWTASGGFAANTGKLTVAIGGTASPTSLTWGTGGFVPNGSALLFGSATANKEADLTNNINLGGGTRTVTVADNAFVTTDFATLSGLLSNGGLIKNGSGLLVLKGANSYTGTTTVTQGALRASDGTGLPATSNLVLNGGVLESVGQTTFSRALGTGANQVQWTGSGGFSASGGKMTVGLNGGAGLLPLTWGKNSFVPNGAALVLGSTSADNETEFQNSIDLDGGDRTVTVVAGTSTLSGLLANGGLTKSGGGRLLLSSANTYSGQTAVTEGTLAVGNSAALGTSAGGTKVSPGATLEVMASVPNEALTLLDLGNPAGPGATTGALTCTGASVAWGSPITAVSSNPYNTNSTIITVATGCSLTATGGISGNVWAVKLGTGTLNLLGQVDVVGLNVVEGTVVIGPGTSGGASTNLRVNNSATIEMRDPVVFKSMHLGADGMTWATLRFACPSFDWSTLTYLDSYARIDVESQRTITASGVIRTIAGLSGLTKVGPGTLVLSATNTYDGPTRIQEGTLRAVDGVGMPQSNLWIEGGVLEGLGTTTFTRSLGTAGGQVQWKNKGGFSANGGKMTVAIGGTASPTALTWGSGSFVSTVSSLVFGSSTADSETEFKNSVNLAGAARTITVNDNPFSAGDFTTLSGTLSNGSLTKNGAGLLALKGNHTYTGSTTISAGTLKLASGATLASTAFDVGSGTTFDVRDLGGGLTLAPGTTLKGGGTVLGTLVAGGVVAPGASPGILTVDDITFAAGSTLQIELGGLARGTQYDVLAASGTVTL